MSARCIACRHHKREQIEAAILGGASTRGVARLHALDDASLNRHMRLHVKAGLARTLSKANGKAENSLAEKVMQMHGEAVGILDRAKRAKTLDAATSAIGQALRALELAGRFSGELAPAGGVNVTLGVRVDVAKGAVEIVQDAQAVAPREVVERALRVIRAWNASCADASERVEL